MLMWLHTLVADERGQDFVEYTLLLAFVVIVSAALLTMSGGSVSAIWCTADNNLEKAKNSVGL